MKKLALKILNPLIALLLLNQVLSALLRGILSDEAFETIHEPGGFLLFAGVVLHLLLNWNWVKATFFKKKK
jgi:sugar phosphate permease